MIITIENPLLKLKGSPVRDTFKHLHKVMGETYHYATDCDFVIVRKHAYYDAYAVFYDARAVGGRIEIELRLRAGDRDYVWQVGSFGQREAHLTKPLIDALVSEGAEAAAQGKPYAPQQRLEVLLQELRGELK